VSEAQHHSLGVAAIFTVTAFSLLVYMLLKPENRPETLRLVISRCSLCAGAYALNAWLMGFEIADMRLQALAAAPVNFALMMTVASICTLQSRSLGTVDISPRARQILRHTPHVFLVCFAINLAMSMAFPVPVLERFGEAPTHYLLNRAFVTVTETFFLGVAAFVSWQATGPHEPVGRIRLQHASFFAAHVALVLIALNTYLAVLSRVFLNDGGLRRSLIESALAREFWIAIGAAVLYALALALYYTDDARTRAITRFSKWLRLRQSLDQRLWKMETETFKARFPNYYHLPDAAWELVERGYKEASRGFSPDEVRLTLDTFKLFVLAANSGERQSFQPIADFDALLRYHRALLRELRSDDIAWAIAIGRGDHDVSYSARQDALPKAIRKVKELLSAPLPRRLVAEPQWFQLATLAAFDSGLLRMPHPSEPIVVMERVNRAYRNSILASRLLARNLASGSLASACDRSHDFEAQEDQTDP
jgi:hypothetical protein